MTYLVRFAFWDCYSKMNQIWNLNCTNLVKHWHLINPSVGSPIETKWKSYLPLLLLPTMSLRFVFPSSSPRFLLLKYFIVDSSIDQWILISGIPLPQISDSIQDYLNSESIRLKLLIPSGFLFFVFGSYSVKMLLVHEYDVCWDCKTKWRKLVQNKAFFYKNLTKIIPFL